MAGLSGSNAWFGVGKNTANAKGAHAATPTFVNPFSGGSANPDRVVEQLQETDNNRDPGSAYLVRGGCSGAPELYVRPESFPAYLSSALGKRVTTPGTPNVHVIDTNVATLPYVTFFKMLGGVIFERYEDCMVNSISVRAEAGQPLVATVNFVGLSVTRSAAVWASAATMDFDAPWFFHEATISIEGSTVTNVRSFELTLENNVSQQQTDSIALYDVVPGRRNLTFSFDMIFDSSVAFDEYKVHNYGSTGGTTQAQTLIQRSLLFTFTKGTDSIQFSIPEAAYEEFPADPDAGGDPVISSVRGSAVRSGSPILAVTVNNDNAGTNYPA